MARLAFELSGVRHGVTVSRVPSPRVRLERVVRHVTFALLVATSTAPKYRFFNNCDPLFTNWVVPIALLDAHKFWM